MKIRTLASLTAASALLLTACGGSGGGDNPDGIDLVQDGTLTVCGEAPYEPFEMEDKSAPSGYTGFDVELTEQVAKKMGLKYVYKDTAFDSLQSGLALNSGECDLGASAMTITEDRKKNLLFTDGYYDSKQSLLVAEGSDIKTKDDLKGKTVGIQTGSTGEIYAKENLDGAELKSFPGDAELWQAIQAGQVDAVLQDLPVNIPHTKDGKFAIVEEYDTGEQYGFAAKKGNDKLIEEFNKELKAMREDGSYDKLYDKYFSTDK